MKSIVNQIKDIVIFDKQRLIYGLIIIFSLLIADWMGLLKISTMLFELNGLQYPNFYGHINSFLIDKVTLLDNLRKFVPQKDFLSDIIAVQAAIISIAIPISFNVISRISERYKSSVIINQFNQQWQVKVLPLLLIFNIALSVCLKFFITNDPKSLLEIILIYLAFFCFLGILGILGLFFQTVKKYSVDTSYLLNQIYKNIENNLNIEKLLKIKDNKQLETIQNKLIESFEAIGDILVVEVSEKKANNTILKGFQKIQDSIIIIFKVKDKNPELFERLVVSSDFHKLTQNNKVNISYQLSFNSDNVLITLTTAINQFIRIHETAVNCNNGEISCYSVDNVIDILKEITISSKNDIIVRKLLKDLTNMSSFSIKTKDYSAYIASIQWYTNIVFDLNNQFDLSYLAIFDEYFWLNIKYIITYDNREVFEGLVSTVTQGITASISSPSTNIRDYFRPYIYKLKRRDDEIINSISRLHSQVYNIYSQDQLNTWINEFNKLKNIVDAKLHDIENEENRDNIKSNISSHSTIIKDLTKELKYKNLQVIIFYAAAYCIFKKQFGYIKNLWNFNQPPDSDAIWVNRNIVSSGLEKIIDFYSKSNLIQRRYWWDNHHGSGIYIKKYFLLLLIREFYKIDPNNYQLTVQKFNLSNDFDSYDLFIIKDWTDDYMKVAEEIKQDNNLFRSLEFDLDKVSESIDNGVIPFLKELKTKAEKSIIVLKRKQKISSNKVQNFKNGVYQGFSELSYVRKIFEYFNLYDDKNNQPVSETDYGCPNQLFPKECFFDNWYSTSSDSGNYAGKNFGRQIAIYENKKIIQQISEYCERISQNPLETIFNDLNNQIQDIFIIASFQAIDNWRNHQQFNDDYNYCPDFQPLPLKSFQGYYLYKEHEIPVFFINSEIIDNNILVLNKFRLGTLQQYLYNKPEDLENPKQFQIEIKAFSEDTELLNNCLDNPFKGLLEKGTRDQQQEYLEQFVAITIIENFEFVKHPEFQGYMIPVENL